VGQVRGDRIPSGTRDVLPDEMRELRAMTDRIRDVFAAAGYGEVSTPALEYEETFARANLPVSASAYRVFDGQGDVLVLRPDMTVPIARLAATRYAHTEGPLRFGYIASAWRGVAAGRGQSREVLQAGVELLGVGGAAGTAEVLTVLCTALDAAGLGSYRIGLGDASLFPSLLEAVGVDVEEQELILSELARGDFVGVEREIRSLSLPAAQAELMLRLAHARGGPEVLEGLEGALHDALAPLREVHALLAAEVAERVIFDLGLVRSLGYYTGAVFQIYDPAFGMPIGRGGRYDDLLATFGHPLPAVGFALNVERLHIALTSEEQLTPSSTTHAADLQARPDAERRRSA
jgi:ATP phosphoribosyltransferase regulatory subunit